MKKNNTRLSPFVNPERYQLTIQPNLKNFEFEGTETIHLAISKKTSEITIHSKDLKISDVVYRKGENVYQAETVSYNIKDETAIFDFGKSLPIGAGELYLKFSGILNDKMRGFYRSRYNHNGLEKHMATTQFEATDARMAFPCFDEPAKKSIFDVTLYVPKELTAISNTIETEVREHSGGYKVIKFAPTPKMSTYLLAFIVGDFEFIESKTKDNVLVRVFVTPGKKHQAKFALDTAVKILEFYNEYFDIPYPLPVLDLIAIPDFSHGAMENWGAVTYRETALLVDPEHSSATNKQWVALVIAHELAHQWFGNLVTMEWWTHLWLNEGFASYIEYLAVDKVFPSWEIWTQFAYADLGVALKLDALKNTHPIEVEVNHPSEIGEIFDEVSYSKGASVIRMLAEHLGEKNFRNGLRYYLKKHSYKNASTVHLWEAFEKVARKPVKKLMENWTSKPGYPLLRIIEQNNKFLISQKRFYSSVISKRNNSDKANWVVPIKLITNKFKTPKTFLLNSKTLSIEKPKKSWLKLNYGESGFFRTDYPAQMLSELKSPISNKKLPALDRLGIIRDAFALAEAGDLPASQALLLTSAYANETDYTVWVEILSGLNTIRNLISDQNYFTKYNEFCCKILLNKESELGWKATKNEPHLKSLLRSLILNQLVNFKFLPAINKASKIGLKILQTPPDIRSVVYAALANKGGEKMHEKFINLYNKSTLNEEQNRLGRALGQFEKIELLKKTLKFAISKSVRIQDTPQIFASVWANPLGRTVAWDFTKKHWGYLMKTYPPSGHIISRFIKPASVFTRKKDADDFKSFFKSHKTPGAERAVAQTLEKIQSNILWLERDNKHLENFIKNN